MTENHSVLRYYYSLPHIHHITYIDIRLMPASETRVLYGFTYALERHLRAGLAATCAPFVPRLAPPWTPRAPRPWQRPAPAASRPARSYASPSRPARPRRAGLGCACGCACGCGCGCGCESGAPGAGRLAPGAPALRVGCRVPRPGHGLRMLRAAHAGPRDRCAARGRRSLTLTLTWTLTLALTCWPTLLMCSTGMSYLYLSHHSVCLGRGAGWWDGLAWCQAREIMEKARLSARAES